MFGHLRRERRPAAERAPTAAARAAHSPLLAMTAGRAPLPPRPLLLLVLLVAGDLGPGRAGAMIEPRLDRPRWWQAPTEPTAGPAPPDSGGDGQESRRPDALPAYMFSPHIVGPKPAPGYSFSAGPKPARFPKPPPSTERPRSGQDGSGADKSLKHLWRSTGKSQAGGARSKDSSRPSDYTSCGPLCPSYRLVSRSNRHDVRLYPRTLWVSYVTVTENRLLAEMEARAGIAEFLGGRNSHGISLPQTYPYVTQLRYGRVPGLRKLEADYSISVPLLEGTIQPRPDSNQLVVDYVGKQRVFVTSFWARPWKLTDKTLRLRAKRFIRRLRRLGHAFLDSYFYLAKYDGSVGTSRRSFYEIWLYSTPFKSKRRFRPTGKPQESRPSNRTLDTTRRLCRGLECPQFEVLSEHRGGIQKRHYFNAVFVTSEMDECDSSIEAMWRGLMPLHLYRHGINSHLEVVEATRPIGMLRVHEAAPAQNASCHMTSLMYLPRRLHRNPPNTGPSAPPTSLAYVHDLHVYVQTVGGFVLEPGRVADEVAAFRNELDSLQLCYRPGQYLVAVYDFIQRYHGRLNEIWMVARRCRGQ